MLATSVDKRGHDGSHSSGMKIIAMTTGFRWLLPAALAAATVSFSGSVHAFCSVLDNRPCVPGFCSVLDNRPCAPGFCSVFDPGPCIPDVGPPFGQNLRLTVQTRSDGESTGKAPADKLDTIDNVFAALRACYLPPPLDQARAGTQITVVFSFNRAGAILGEPRFTYMTPGLSSEVRAAYQRAVAAALKRCNPLAFSPALGGALAGRPFAIRFIDNRDFHRPEKRT